MNNSAHVYAFSACTSEELSQARKTPNQERLRELCARLGMEVVHEYKATDTSYRFTPKKAIDEFRNIVALHKERAPEIRRLFVVDNLLLFRLYLPEDRYHELTQLGQVFDRLIFERDAEVYFDLSVRGGFDA